MPFRAVALATALAMISGCASIQPQPIAAPELRTTAAADRVVARQDVDPINGPITLEEAIARALKYNLERRSRMMEEAIALNQLDASKYDMLPKLLAQAGYHWRDKDLVTRSKDSVTGQPALSNPFITSERHYMLDDLGLTWNLLDFGASYYAAKQNADRVLIALERRRKAMHVLIQDVRTAFWRTASAQKLQKQVQDAIALAEDALKDARKAETERVRSPVESLRYQRQVLENLRLLESTNQELTTARIELAHLMNAPLSADFRVVEPAEGVSHAMLDVPVQKLEAVAVARNAELHESFYNARIARDETRKVMLRLFPGITFNYNTKYDTDSYLVNRNWNEAGASISFNLMNLLSGPSQKRLADAGVALADQRRVAMQMAVLAQVHIARLQYANALNQYERAQAVADVDERIVEIMAKREAAQVQSKLETVANRTTAILSLLRRYQALAQAHAAASRLQATLGVEPEFGSMQDLSLAQLEGIVSKALAQWNAGDLPDDSGAKPARPAKPAGKVAVAMAATQDTPAAPHALPASARVAAVESRNDLKKSADAPMQRSEVAAAPDAATTAKVNAADAPAQAAETIAEPGAEVPVMAQAADAMPPAEVAVAPEQASADATTPAQAQVQPALGVAADAPVQATPSEEPETVATVSDAPAKTVQPARLQTVAVNSDAPASDAQPAMPVVSDAPVATQPVTVTARRDDADTAKIASATAESRTPGGGRPQAPAPDVSVTTTPPALPSDSGTVAPGKYLVFHAGEGNGPGRKMFKWVDDEGVIRYTEAAPAHHMSMIVNVSGALPPLAARASLSAGE